MLGDVEFLAKFVTEAPPAENVAARVETLVAEGRLEVVGGDPHTYLLLYYYQA